jgi:hypothetical protein
MKRKKHEPKGSYEVGFGRPPVSQRFGSPERKASPSRRAAPAGDDDVRILDQSLTVNHRGRKVEMHNFEVQVRSLARDALNGKARSMDRFVKLATQYGAFEHWSNPVRHVLELDLSIPSALAHALVDEIGLPPWSDEELDLIKQSANWPSTVKWETLRKVWR